MNSDLSLLAITPAPLPQESLYGYVLRVSEANGYESPWHILHHAGLSQNNLIKSTTPSAPIARIVGYPVEELQKLPWQHYPNGQPAPALNRGLPKILRQIDIRSPKICPICVEENGYIDAAWDLKIMLACPKHGTPLVRTCSSCGRPLTWYRPGMRVCRCKAAITNQSDPQMSPRSRALLRLVYKVLYGDTIPLSDAEAMGMPQASLLSMHIDDVLGLIQRIRSFTAIHELNRSALVLKPYTTVELDAIAAAFENWPNGFHELLRNLKPDHAGITNSSSVRKRYEHIYTNLLNRKTKNDGCLEFVRKAFVEFAMVPGSNVYVDPRILKRVGIAETALLITKASALARRLGLDARTVKAVAESGFAKKIHARTSNGKPRLLYEIGDIAIEKDTSGTLCARKAAAELGIPVSVLNGLRKSKCYEDRHMGSRLKSFHRSDVEQLRKRVLKSLPMITVADGPDRISLKKVFRMKFRTDAAKTRLVEAILTNKIKPLGRSGEQIPDVAIRRSDLAEFQSQEIDAKDDMLPAEWAANLLRCNPCAIGPLILAGHLQGIYRPRFIRVTRESLDAFADRYVSCARVADAVGTSTRGILSVLRQHNAAPLFVIMKHSGQHQVFFDRSHLGIFEVGSLPLYFRQAD